MYKSIFVLLLLFIGCDQNITQPNDSRFVNGIVRDVQFIQEDNSRVYVAIHFEDKVVKFRSYCSEFIVLPLNKEVNVYYDNTFFITKIDTLENKFQ